MDIFQYCGLAVNTVKQRVRNANTASYEGKKITQEPKENSTCAEHDLDSVIKLVPL